jgi:hypothetical protein
MDGVGKFGMSILGRFFSYLICSHTDKHGESEREDDG